MCVSTTVAYCCILLCYNVASVARLYNIYRPRRDLLGSHVTVARQSYNTMTGPTHTKGSPLMEDLDGQFVDDIPLDMPSRSDVPPAATPPSPGRSG